MCLYRHKQAVSLSRNSFIISLFHNHNHIIFMFIKGARLEVVFFTIIGVIAPLLHRMSISCRTGLTRGFFLTKPPPVFFASDGQNPFAVSRFRLRELPRNPQKGINNDETRMSICISASFRRQGIIPHRLFLLIFGLRQFVAPVDLGA